ncbi:MAG: hypothetical protein MK207_14720 [Saprospiraceae bacterium]|nr:hypothetical protein [Saprospiraceae bacterium]
MELNQLLIDNNPVSWELAFQDFVKAGTVSVDDWFWEWLYLRITWPDEDFSLFCKGNIIVKTQIFGINLLIETGDNNKRRFVQVTMYENNPYHPDFFEIAQVSELEWRFPSSGNPFLDEPKYRLWEKYLFSKLLNYVFIDKKGLDFLIEYSRR